MNNTTNLIISLSSIILALVTAIVLISEFRKKRPNINIITSPDTAYIFVTDVFEVIHEALGTRLYKWVRIENNSANPISICKFTIKVKNSSTFYCNINDNPPSHDLIPDKFIIPIVKLDPYSAIEGYIFFRSIGGKLIDKKEYTLIVKTVPKDFKFKFKLDFTARDI